MIGLILAGGQSRRFGSDKALYTLPQQRKTNVELAFKKISPYCKTVYISTNTNNQYAIKRLFNTNPNVKVIIDQEPYVGHGPLSGLYALLTQVLAADVLMIAVDYPYITKQEIEKLLPLPSYLVTSTASHYAIAHLKITLRQLEQILQQNNWQLKNIIRAYCQPIKVDDSPTLVNMNYRPGGMYEN